MNYKGKINEFRKKKNWSINRRAIEAELNPATVNNWFTRNTTPTLDALFHVVKCMGITVSEFFSETENAYYPTAQEKELLTQWQCLSLKEQKNFLNLLASINECKKQISSINK